MTSAVISASNPPPPSEVSEAEAATARLGRVKTTSASMRGRTEERVSEKAERPFLSHSTHRGLEGPRTNDVGRQGRREVKQDRYVA